MISVVLVRLVQLYLTSEVHLFCFTYNSNFKCSSVIFFRSIFDVGFPQIAVVFGAICNFILFWGATFMTHNYFFFIILDKLVFFSRSHSLYSIVNTNDYISYWYNSRSSEYIYYIILTEIMILTLLPFKLNLGTVMLVSNQCQLRLFRNDISINNW